MNSHLKKLRLSRSKLDDMKQKKFDKIQLRLVERAERANYVGLRHKGLSGTICEDLLLEELRQLFPILNFDRGVIQYGDSAANGHALKQGESLSPQVDIIVYRDKPKAKIIDAAVVPVKQVVAALEIKKWANPKALRSHHSKLQELAVELKRAAYRPIPTYYVTFRFHDRAKIKVNWWTESRAAGMKNGFCFFGPTPRNEYPWEYDKDWLKSDNPYSGQFEKLVEAIRKAAQF